MYFIYFIPLFTLLVYLFCYNRISFKNLISKYSIIVLYLLIAIILGNILQFLLYPFAGGDASQMNGLNYLLLMNVLVFLSFLIVDNSIKNKKIKISFNLFLIIVSIYSCVIFYFTRVNQTFNPVSRKSETFITNVVNYFKQNEISCFGASIISAEETEFNTKLWSRGELMNGYWFIPYSTSLDFLYITNINYSRDNNQYNNNLISKFRFVEDRDLDHLLRRKKRNIETTPFSVFVTNYQKTHGITNNDSLKYIFINKHKIGYISVSKLAKLPSIFLPIIDTIFVDELSGEKFIFLEKDYQNVNFGKTKK